mmetsp:Transcript_131834/g.367515  ORF Transcript_131834/g.367515 Transcript_131834/m.367515 type:complete len:107 (-) Transcript_131834:165-485(-)
MPPKDKALLGGHHTSAAWDMPWQGWQQQAPVEEFGIWPDEPFTDMAPEDKAMLSKRRDSSGWDMPWHGWQPQGPVPAKEDPLPEAASSQDTPGRSQSQEDNSLELF